MIEEIVEMTINTEEETERSDLGHQEEAAEIMKRKSGQAAYTVTHARLPHP